MPFRSCSKAISPNWLSLTPERRSALSICTTCSKKESSKKSEKTFYNIWRLPSFAIRATFNNGMNKNLYVVLMAGGVGVRFWPYSRNARPKQFLDVLGTGKSLIQSTLERFLPICPQENIFVVTHEEHAGIVREQLPQLNPEQILAEPMRKNTAA